MAERDEKNQQEHDTLLEMISRKIKMVRMTIASLAGWCRRSSPLVEEAYQ